MGTYYTTATSQADYRNRRTKDEKDEKIVGDYLDTYFYPTFAITVTRNTDKDTQINGLDVTASSREWTYTIDEKAATRWAGRNLQTFAHEITSVNKSGKEYDGWLLDFHSSSDYLLEVWIDELGNTSNTLNSAEDIKDATMCLIKKSDLWNYLRKKDIKSTELKELGDSMRTCGTSSTYYKGFKVICSHDTQEMSANILIPRSTLINTISIYSVQIKDGKVTTLRKVTNI